MLMSSVEDVAPGSAPQEGQYPDLEGADELTVSELCDEHGGQPSRDETILMMPLVQPYSLLQNKEILFIYRGHFSSHMSQGSSPQTDIQDSSRVLTNLGIY